MTEKKLKKKNNPHELREEFPIEKIEEEKEEEKKEEDWEKEKSHIENYIKTAVVVPITKIKILYLFSLEKNFYGTLKNISERISPLASKDFKETIIEEALEGLVNEGIVEKIGEEEQQLGVLYFLKELEKAKFIIGMMQKEEIEGLEEEVKEYIKRKFLIPCVRLEILKFYFLKGKSFIMETCETIANEIKRHETITEKTEGGMLVKIPVVKLVLEELVQMRIIKKTKLEEGNKICYSSSISDQVGQDRVEEIEELIKDLIIKYVR